MNVMSAQARPTARPPATARPPHLLHVFPSFTRGGVPIRIAGIVNLLGGAFRHTIVSMDGCFDCRGRLDPDLGVAFAPPPEMAVNLPRRVARLRACLRDNAPDLLLTYNWGAVEWALANALAPLAPQIHFESGFGPEEADGQLRRRALMRRVALRRVARLVVPSQTLVRIATHTWKLNPDLVAYVPNGVDVPAFERPSEPGAPPGLAGTEDHLLVGTLAPLRREKNLARLVRAFAAARGAADATLAIAGDGPERGALEALATDLGIGDRVVFLGHVERVADVLARFDVFAMSSDTEQMPNSLLQAMAAGLPVVATDVGDVKHILPGENAPFVVPKLDEALLAGAMGRVLADRALRARLGQANRDHVKAHYAMERMLDAYARLYESALATNGPRTAGSGSV
ncbi:MAG: glycosyltransferase family 4 protein [Kiloniellaceae bacterium]